MGTVWPLLLVYPLLAVGADSGWVHKAALQDLRTFTTGFYDLERAYGRE